MENVATLVGDAWISKIREGELMSKNTMEPELERIEGWIKTYFGFLTDQYQFQYDGFDVGTNTVRATFDHQVGKARCHARHTPQAGYFRLKSRNEVHAPLPAGDCEALRKEAG